MGKATLAEVRALVAQIRGSQPDIGNKKLVAEIKRAQPQWELSNKELRNALRPLELKQKRADASQPGADTAAPVKKRGAAQANTASIATPAPKKQKMAQAVVSNETASAGSLPASFPYQIDESDHAETPAAAYEDIAPVLRSLAKHLSKPPAELKIWDPFYCTGAAAQRLAAVGFPSVHHRCEDFHAIVAAGGGAVPEHDVLVTNPPYSAEHLEKLFEHCVGSGKAWACCCRGSWSGSLGSARTQLAPARAATGLRFSVHRSATSSSRQNPWSRKEGTGSLPHSIRSGICIWVARRHREIPSLDGVWNVRPVAPSASIGSA